ncbi:histidine kinase dimerization/phosphoacceptor domain -containing protein [Allomuricauda sp. d1]|uniref:sensor histidine kinase n=1 Tax=Allomuricauda sp. d1 TaxID=3136725 RepID=UPI0031D46096
MLKYYKEILMLAIACLALNGLYGQSTDTEVENPLLQFQDIANDEKRFDYFFGTPNRYSDNSAYDWQEVVNVYLTNAQKTKDSNAIESYQIIQAGIFSDIGDYDKSVALANEIYAALDSVDSKKLKVVMNILDTNYGNLQLFDKQIEIRQEKRERGITEGVTFYDIYAKLGMNRKAMTQYIMEVKPTIADDDEFSLAKFHNQVGNYLRLDNSAQTAISEYKKANGYLLVYINDLTAQKTPQEELESELLKAEIEGNIGKCHVQLGEFEEAVPLLENSIKVFEEVESAGMGHRIVENTLSLADAHLQLENFSAAKRRLDVDFENVDLQQRMNKNRLLAAYYDKTENFKSAATYYKRNNYLKDSIENKESSIMKQQLVAIVANEDLENSRRMIDEQKAAIERTRSEMQAKDERINLVFISLIFTLLGFAGLVYAYLKSIKNQRLIAQQKHIIEDSLIEKESLLKEIHHRVKNNLQMVSSLLSLQTKNTRSKAAIIALEEGKSRVKAMALIHQKLYQNDDLSVIEMQGYIESLINSVQSVYKKGGHNISITIDAEGTELDIDRAIPFGLILNELVSNSFKYAFPEGDDDGKIYIHLRKNGEQGYFEYADNGVGLPEDTDERSLSSMGLRLINRLVNQLQSKLNIDKTNEGVRFWFNFA